MAPPAPSPPFQSTSIPELRGLDRLRGPAPHQGYVPARPSSSPSVHFNEAQLAMLSADNSALMAGIKDELTIAAGRVTPGVDDGPYIQYALEALTRDRGSTSAAQFFPSGTSASYPEPYTPPQAQQEDRSGHVEPAPIEPSEIAPTKPIEPTPAERAVDDEEDLPEWPLPLPEDPTPEEPIPHSKRDIPSRPLNQQPLPMPDSSRWIPIDKGDNRSIALKKHSHPPLTFKPRILRPFSMLILMILSILMVAALIFSAIYSDKNNGLTPYPGSIYSGQYFVFRILPQLLGAIILIYAQSIVIASFRILPFCAMADDVPQKRSRALFQRLYPKSFLWPQMTGPWQVKVFGFVTWLLNFTIPLQSVAFTCILVSSSWVWAAVPGVVWTLVALYLLLLLSTAALMAFWFRRWTGLVYDIRSIGGLVPLLYRSNTLESYEGMDLAEGGESFKKQLQHRHFDRLGYWQAEGDQSGAAWYTIGTSAADQDIRQHTIFNVTEKRISFGHSDGSRFVDVHADWYQIRHRYLPWSLRSMTLVAFFGTAVVLLLALLIVSFLPQTRIDRGFYPLLSAKPSKGAFSPANFLYGFLPSLLGMILFLLFQSLDLSLRILQPWGDLSNQDGSKARASVLADYAACLPLQSTWKAASNCHWRVAVMSLTAVIFLIIPVLAGGLFMALTNAKNEVRMFPNMPVFGVLLAFLFLYVGCLSLMLPHRQQFRLPHPVTNLAEIISFCTARETYQDEAFRDVKSRGDLEGRLCVDDDSLFEERKWFFGSVPGRDEHRLSIRRPGRLTEKRLRSPQSDV